MGCSISNVKIKSNTPYPILLIEVILPPIEIIAMTRYLMYKHRINNMGNERLPKVALNSSQNQLCLKQCWCKDTMAWLTHWGINENDMHPTMHHLMLFLWRHELLDLIQRSIQWFTSP